MDRDARRRSPEPATPAASSRQDSDVGAARNERAFGNGVVTRILTNADARRLTVVATRGPAGNAAIARLLAGGHEEGAGDGSAAARGEIGPELTGRINARKGAGSPLPDEVRVPLQEQLGVDLGAARVHADAEAAALAEAVEARAFTTGQDIFFGAGQYQLTSPSGRDLLAHEVVHVAQQSGGPLASGGRVSDPADPAEVEARSLAAELAGSIGSASRPLGGTQATGSPATTVAAEGGVHREPDAGSAPSTSDAGGSASASAPGGPSTTQTGGGPERDAQLRRAVYQVTVLRDVPPLSVADRAALSSALGGLPLYDLLVERDDARRSLEQQRAWIKELENRNAAITAGLGPGESLPGGVGASSEELDQNVAVAEQLARRVEELSARIDPELEAMGTDEAQVRQFVEEEYPALWTRRAVAIVSSMLDQNAELARREQARYGGNACTIDASALQRADQTLKNGADEIREVERQRQQAQEILTPGGESLPGGIPEGADEAAQTVRVLTARLSELQASLQKEHTAQAVNFPILLSADYTPGVFQDASEERIQEITGGWTTEVLESIETTRRNVADGRLKVWDLADVPMLTWASLGQSPEGTLGRAVERQQQRERSEEEARRTALTALMIGAGVVATIATLGGATLLAAGAGGLATGLGLGQLGEDVARYQMESAAGGVSLDKDLADISVNEPELLPIILDVVGTGMDLAGAVAFVRAMTPVERALAAEGRLVTISPQTRHLALSRPALLAEYERVANGKIATVVRDVLAHQRTTAKRARLLQLRLEFDQLRRSVPVGQALTAQQRQQAETILRQARDLARADFNNVRDAVWLRLRKDADLRLIEQQLQQAGDAADGGTALTVRTRRGTETSYQPLGVEHRTRLSDDPWKYNDPANLIVTDAPQNEQFLEALRAEGHVWPTGDVEAFVIRHGLNDQGIDFAP